MRDPETIEEELALFAEAIEAGIDPFPEPKKVFCCILFNRTNLTQNIPILFFS